MLSRVAESLYWMSRNIERAESLLQQQITPAEQATLFEAFVADLQGSAN